MRQLADPGRALGLIGLAGEIGHRLQRVDILGHGPTGCTVELENARVRGGPERVRVRIGQGILQDRPQEAVAVQGQQLDASIELPSAQDRRQGTLDRIPRGGEVTFGTLGHVAPDDRVVLGDV